MNSLNSSNTSSPLLSADGIWKVFGPKPQHALDLADDGATRADVLTETGCTIGVRDASFGVLPGETFVIMGLSGSGKSTLLRCVSRLSPATRGTVSLEGQDLTSMSESTLRQVRREKMSMVFQHFGLFPHRRVIDNVAYGLEVQGMDRTTRHAKANETLDLVGLQGWGDHYPEQLSGGMQQRVGLARALVVDPTILFFDEPFSALDPLIRRDMQDELLRLQAEMNGTILFVTHDFDEAIKLGDRIAVMKDGEFDQVGTAAELVSNPATDYVREFVKDISRAKVLRSRDAMTALADDAPATDRTVDASARLEEVVPMLVAGTDEINVVEGDEVVGRIDRATVLDLITP